MRYAGCHFLSLVSVVPGQTPEETGLEEATGRSWNSLPCVVTGTLGLWDVQLPAYSKGDRVSVSIVLLVVWVSAILIGVQ